MGQTLKGLKWFGSSSYDVSTIQLDMQWMGDLGYDLTRAVFLLWPLHARRSVSAFGSMMQPRSRGSNVVPF